MTRFEKRDAIDADKKKLNIAFRKLSKRGLLARQKHLCCGGCARDDLFGRHRNEIGYVYYHDQDDDDRTEGCPFYVRFGVFEDHEQADTLLGHLLCAELEAAGLKTLWDGDPMVAIRVESPLPKGEIPVRRGW